MQIINSLSARQRDNNPFENHFILRLLLFLVALFLLTACNEKTNGQQASGNKSNTVDTISNKPNVNITVNKHYDDDGNLIGYDSTYSSFYSNVEGDTARMNSTIQSFDQFFKKKHPTFFDDEFNTLFFNDSLGYPDFFYDDFFQKRYELNDFFMKKMMKRMDSIKNRFYMDQEQKLRENKKDDT